VIDVAAVGAAGQVEWYSNYGTNILVSAGAAAVTTDLMGGERPQHRDRVRRGLRIGVRGTSAATPVVTGVIALMLDANDDLGWRDVREILATSASLTGSIVTGNQTDEVSGTYFQMNDQEGDTWNDGGRGYSLDYGFGNVNAYAASEWPRSGRCSTTQAPRTMNCIRRHPSGRQWRCRWMTSLRMSP